MKRVKINPDKITDLDLKLAKNERVIACLDEILALSPDERAARLRALHQKIRDGQTTLFEERVLVRLLENRTAEWIRVIHKNLPTIEAERQKRQTVQPSDPSSAPPPTETAPAAVTLDDPSPELLAFLASQKPPAPPAARSDAARAGQGTGRVTPSEPRGNRLLKDIVIGASLLLVLGAAFWYVVFASDTQPTLQTFDQQAAGDAADASRSEEAQQYLQTQFDAALQQLHFEDFEQGKTRLLELSQQYPATSQARTTYIAIADAYRQRQHNADEALRYYQRFLDEYPDSPDAGLVQLKMGFAYEDLQDGDSAAALYRLIRTQYGDKSRLGQLAQARLQALEKTEAEDETP
jgi:TolA-binding protein